MVAPIHPLTMDPRPKRGPIKLSWSAKHPVAAGATIRKGGMVAMVGRNCSAAREGVGPDDAAKAAEAATHFVVGVAAADVRGGASDGAVRIGLNAGWFVFEIDGDDPVTLADKECDVFVVDDKTIGKTSRNKTRPKAGVLVDVDQDGAWVRIGADSVFKYAP